MKRVDGASFPVFALLLTVAIGNAALIQAKSLGQQNLADPILLFSDGFDRGDSSTVDNGWEEVETTGATVGIQGNRLCFSDTSDIALRPIVRHTFQQVSGGDVFWRFDFDWTRQFRENSYQLLMQLGEGTFMSDGDPNAGVGVNLVWMQIGGVHERLAYRRGGVDTPLLVLSGAASLEVHANLESRSYELTINGVSVQSGIPFDKPVNLNTVRFLTDGLNEVYFSGRCFDNLTIESVLETISPTPTFTPTPTATSTDTPIPTASSTAALTETPTAAPSPSETSIPSDTPTPSVTWTATGTSTETLSPASTDTPTPTGTPEPSNTATETLLPTATPTPTATITPTPLPSIQIYKTIEIELLGPNSIGMGTPNPFLVDVQVTFQGPEGELFTVHGFYDGDGVGGMDGNLWKVRFSPGKSGVWTYFSTSSEPLLNGQTGAFQVVTPASCPAKTIDNLPNFNCVGRLEYVGGHYLRFANGLYWLKGGADDPEDFLAPGINVGFSNKQAAIDFLTQNGVNSIYLLLNNIGGDGNNVWPWVGATASEAQTNHERFDLARLAEWESIFDYLQEKGIALHFVLEDDSGWTGFNRSLYYRQIVARFGHYNGVIWNISEEFNENYTASQVKSFAQMIRDLDPYAHPITVHHIGSLDAWLPFVGDNRFDLTGFQTDKSPQNAAATSWFELVENSGHTIPVSFDETGMIGVSDRDLARHILWSIYMGGGNFELHTFPISDYHDFTLHFADLTRARNFIENLPFWNMRPHNELVLSGQAYVFSQPAAFYSVYLPVGGQITLDLSASNAYFDGRWFNPRDGSSLEIGYVEGGGARSFNAPDIQDWVLILTLSSTTPTPTPTPTDTMIPTDTATITPSPTASSTPTATFTPSPSVTPMVTATAPVEILFSDAFERADGSAVGNGWVEVEATGANAGIQGNRLCFLDTSDVLNRPLVRHTFLQASAGVLTWEFDFDWTRTGNEGSYRLFMQLGEGGLMSDSAQDAGVGVNLVWTNVSGVHQTLAYRLNGAATGLTVVSGSARLRVEANLDTDTYALYVNDTLIQAGIPFGAAVNLDTVRLFTDGLNEVNFSGRCFDDLTISHGGSSGAPATIFSTPITSGSLWQAYSYDVNASGDPLPTYALLNAPAGMTINQANGLITWTPGLNGTFLVRVQAANIFGSDTQQFTLVISTAPQFTCAAPIRIMPLGDSITVGKSSGVDDPTQQISYRKDLFDNLIAASRSVDFVGSVVNGEFYPGFDPQHEGHSGWTDAQIAFNIYDNGGANWLNLNPPEVVLLHIGTNALNPDPTDVQNILNEIDQYEAATNRRVIVVLARIIDMVPNNPTVHQFNDNVQVMAQARIENGDQVILVDMEDGAGLIYSLQPAGDMWDSLHPFATGYTKMADVWFDALDDILPVCP